MVTTRRGAARSRGELISKLTDDLVMSVFSFLEPQTLECMMLLSRRFSAIALEDILWWSLLRDEVGETNLPKLSAASGGPSWRDRMERTTHIEM